MQTRRCHSILLPFLVGFLFFQGLPMRAESNAGAPKDYISPQQLLTDSYKLAKRVVDSDFQPTFLIALWRGGSLIGMAITELFTYVGQPIRNHCAIRASAYEHDRNTGEVQIFGLESIAQMIKPGDKILIVDDVVDSGITVQKFIQELKVDCGCILSDEDIKVATIYYKPKTACIAPDFYIHETSDWLVFPHELEGMTIQEIAACRGVEVARLVE